MENSLGSSEDRASMSEPLLNILTWPRTLSKPNLRVHLKIDGEPISKQRPRFVRRTGHTYTPQRTMDAEENIRWSIKAGHSQLFEDGDSAFGVRVVFHCKGQQRRDIDNMCKLILDACNGFVWKDDRQVEELYAHVFRNQPVPHTELAIYVFPGSMRAKELPLCESCHKPFETFPSWSKKGRRHCSSECRMVATRNALIVVKCGHCSKDMQKTAGEVARKRPARNPFFCSLECKSLHKTVQLTCEHCSISFSRPQSLNKSGKKFCSKVCQLAYWKPIRVKQAYGICQNCGNPTSKKEYTHCRACHIASGKFRSPGRQPGENAA